MVYKLIFHFRCVAKTHSSTGWTGRVCTVVSLHMLAFFAMWMCDACRQLAGSHLIIHHIKLCQPALTDTHRHWVSLKSWIHCNGGIIYECWIFVSCPQNQERWNRFRFHPSQSSMFKSCTGLFICLESPYDLCQCKLKPIFCLLSPVMKSRGLLCRQLVIMQH